MIQYLDVTEINELLFMTVLPHLLFHILIAGLFFSRGHTKRVVTLCMSPTDDSFLSGSLDKTIRLWDLRSPNCQGLMQLSGRPVAAFDPEGLIFAAGINSETVKLYDLRSFDKGPFSSFRLQSERRNSCLFSFLELHLD